MNPKHISGVLIGFPITAPDAEFHSLFREQNTVVDLDSISLV